MIGCEGREVSIGEVDFAAATEEGSVSGSKSAFKILASLAERVVFGVGIAIFGLGVVVVLVWFWSW